MKHDRGDLISRLRHTNLPESMNGRVADAWMQDVRELRDRLARIERGIRTLATGKEGLAEVARQSGDEDTALRAERDAAELRGLLDGE